MIILSLFLGLLIGWMIVSFVNSQPVSYYQSTVQPSEIIQVDESLVAVGLAQFPENPSIMDSINQPVAFPGPASSPGPGPGPAPVAVAFASPGPAMTNPGPARNTRGPVSSPMSPSPVLKAGSPAPGPSFSPARR